MSNIIDLALNQEFGEEPSSSKDNHLIQNTKMKRVLGAILEKVEEYFKTNRVIIDKSSTSYKIHTQLPSFYLAYSLFSSITWFHSQGRIIFANKLLFEQKPFTLLSKSLRLAALQLFSQANLSFPGFTFSVNMQNGEISICSLLNTSQVTGKFDQIFHEILIKIFLTLYDSKEQLVRIVRLLSKSPVPETTNATNLQKNTKLFSKLLKYVKISFVELEGSEMQLDRRKGLKTTQFAQQINLAEEEQVNFINKELLSSLLLYQNTHGNRINLRQLQLSEFEVKELNPYMSFPKAKIMNSSQNQYIFNDIFVENAKNINLISTNMRGGTSELFIARVAFEYIFSSKFMFDMFNKSQIPGQKLEKIVLVKKANNKLCQKYIDHQLKILQNFKSASSAYMIKYYKNEQISPLKNKLIMDYLQGSLNLDKFILKNKYSLSIMSKLLILSNISNGLRFLKRHKIVHMDLNPLNILMAPGLLTKIIDFGESYCQRTCGPSYSPGFTNPYSAPQIFTNKSFDLKQDIFSLGIISFKILFQNLPFHPSQILKQSYKMRDYHNRMFFAPESSQYIWIEGPIYILLSLIMRCLSLNSQHRPYPIWIRIISRMIMEWYNNAFRKL